MPSIVSTPKRQVSLKWMRSARVWGAARLCGGGNRGFRHSVPVSLPKAGTYRGRSSQVVETSFWQRDLPRADLLFSPRDMAHTAGG